MGSELNEHKSDGSSMTSELLAGRELILASGSRYRARILAEAGLVARTDPPQVDERKLDPLFEQLGPEGFALELARLKAGDVAPRHPDAIVIAGDQVGVLTTRTGPRQLNKRPDEDSATAQLMSMAGTTHSLVNGIVVIDTAAGSSIEATDIMKVTMRSFTEAEARSYVRRFEPYDCSGSYRIEDQAEMGPGEGFISKVEGEHESGVKGLPLPLLRRMIAELAGL
ncbi:MAG: Maf family protein [Microthrixaceae bacterium]